MKIYLPFNHNLDLRLILRRAGYSEFLDPNTNKSSFTKRFTRDFYPRFHAYIEQDKENKTFINLHLDQKKPSYAGSSAHNAEYDGGLVEQEISRLQGLIKNQTDNQSQQKPVEEKKGFWEKLFH
ncbi:MAG: hypothetical protein PHW73_09005 [Atribacterota bacterium]|nr:hypothetical protein [Atribacterota bacterium]